MASTFECKIHSALIIPHPNADRLELCCINGEDGFKSIVGKGNYVTGDPVIFVEPDSLLSDIILLKLQADLAAREAKTGGKGVKVERRVQATKIRGVLSEGLILNPKDFLKPKDIVVGNDVAALLGVTKHREAIGGAQIPQQQGAQQQGVARQRFKLSSFPHYQNFDRLEKCPHLFAPGEPVVVTEKMHGSNARCGHLLVDVKPKNFWHRCWRWITRQPTQEWRTAYGSHNVVKNPGVVESDYYVKKLGEDIYIETMRRCGIDAFAEKLSKVFGYNVVVFGEIIGPGVQTNYSYGLTQRIFIAFDIVVDGKYLPWDYMKALCEDNNIPHVAELYRGPWDISIKNYAIAKSCVGDWSNNREGIVVKSVADSHKALKIINPNYLLDKKNSSAN
jgi:RNA ligase (TIGR02306 family)